MRINEVVASVQQELKKFNKLETKLRVSIKKRYPKAFYRNCVDAIELITRGVFVVRTNFEKVQELVIRRGQLIDLQVAEEEFSGPLHNNYHKICNLLEAEMDNLFQSIKTLTNRIPPLLVLFMNNLDKRSLRPKSFGAFISSLKKRTNSDPSFMSRYGWIVERGEIIDSENNLYRDKRIEHAKPASIEDGMMAVSGGFVRKFYYKLKEPPVVKSKSSVIK